MKLDWQLVDSPETMEQLMDLIQEIWPEVFTPIIGQEQVTYMLAHYQNRATIEDEIAQGAKYYLLTYQDQPLGYTAFEDQDDFVYLSKLYLHHSARGKGLMTSVIDTYLTIAQGKPIRLNVNKHNLSSIKIYEHWGFLRIGQRQVDIGSGFVMDDYIYEKNSRV